MRLFQAFTNNSEAFTANFVKKKKKPEKRALKGGWNNIEEGRGNKIREVFWK